jgi:lauroyl/myristoyl acyltransferase
MKNFKHILQYIIIYFFFLLSLILPISLLSYLIKRFFSFIGPLIKRSNIIRKNIKICIPQISQLEIEEIVKKLWVNLGACLGEFFYLNRMSDKEFNSLVISSDFPTELIKGNGLLISAHYSNWEVLPRFYSTKFKTNINILYKIQSNKYADKLLYKLRANKNIKLIPNGLSGLTNTVRLFKKKELVAMLLDQRVGGGVKIDFFNRAAMTTIAPIALAIKYQVPIFLTTVKRNKTGYYTVEFEKLLFDYEKESPENLMLLIHKKFESWILESPEDWFTLLHDRWKI